ncbi:MAG: hypothetical protein BMS9Abin25_1476 [Gammaproteobacteria bacterium]|nr:MAG: hypothetical protein BMS9Abin25_1476 [Gammaproteobacteria bacterium]
MPEEKLNKFTAYALAIIFLAAIFIPFLGSIIKTDTIKSVSEKRILTPLPEKPNSIKTLKRYPKKFNLYFQDNFGFRENLMLHHKLKYWLGDSPSEKVMRGKDGWLFFKGDSSIDLQDSFRGIRRFKESELKQYAVALDARYKWLANNGIQYLLVIAPNKHTIYPEYLPDSMFQVNDKTLTDQFFSYIQQHTDVPVLDLRQALLKAKTNDKLLYYKTDTHWNHYGSNIAQYEIAKILASFYPQQIKPLFYNKRDFIINPVAGGDLAVLLGKKLQYKEYNPNPILDPCARRPIPLDGDYTITFTTQCAKSSLNAVIFRDSFFEYLYQYISLYFNRVTFISKRLEFSDMAKYIEGEKPDIVIEEWAERFLTDIPEVEPEFTQTN